MMTAGTIAASGALATAAAAETVAFGRRLAAALGAGDLVALRGDLGAGKTCLIQGLAAGLGVREIVNSPTFVLHNIYRGATLTVHHFDLYRLSCVQELEELGADEFFGDPEAVCLVEWAERAGPLLPAGHWQVDLEHGAGPEERLIRWRRHSAAGAQEGDRP